MAKVFQAISDSESVYSESNAVCDPVEEESEGSMTETGSEDEGGRGASVEGALDEEAAAGKQKKQRGRKKEKAALQLSHADLALDQGARVDTKLRRLPRQKGGGKQGRKGHARAGEPAAELSEVSPLTSGSRV